MLNSEHVHTTFRKSPPPPTSPLAVYWGIPGDVVVVVVVGFIV